MNWPGRSCIRSGLNRTVITLFLSAPSSDRDRRFLELYLAHVRQSPLRSRSMRTRRSTRRMTSSVRRSTSAGSSDAGRAFSLSAITRAAAVAGAGLRDMVAGAASVVEPLTTIIPSEALAAALCCARQTSSIGAFAVRTRSDRTTACESAVRSRGALRAHINGRRTDGSDRGDTRRINLDSVTAMRQRANAQATRHRADRCVRRLRNPAPHRLTSPGRHPINDFENAATEDNACGRRARAAAARAKAWGCLAATTGRPAAHGTTGQAAPRTAPAAEPAGSDC